jgi:adenylate cyclase
MKRKLAAILIADVVGYSRLSHVDEEGTRTRFLSNMKEIVEPKIAEHEGRLVKTMGDGLLVEFPSIVNALHCAIEVQQAEARRNTDLPGEQQLHFRIGINLGDVIVELQGKPVLDTEHIQDLLASAKVNEKIVTTVIRGGAPLELSITLGERPAK